MNGLRNDPWFTKGYNAVQPLEENTDDSDDVAAVFGNNEVRPTVDWPASSRARSSAHSSFIT